MKRIFFFLIAVMLLGGPMSAQNHYTYNYHDFEHKITIVAQININGIEQTSSDFEIGAFDASNNVTGSALIGEYGSNHYHRAYFAVFYNRASDGPYYTYKLYNHATGEELTNYTITDHLGAPLTFEWSDENGYGTNKKPVIFNFVTTSSQTFTKEITGYGNGRGNWYLIASPIGDVAPTNVTNMINGNGYDLYRFNQNPEETDVDGVALKLEWENYKQQGDHYHFNLESGKGYLYANSDDVELVFTGAPVTGTTQDVPLTFSGGNDLSGWNLVGNPFPVKAYITGSYNVMNADGTGLIAADDDDREAQSVNPMEGIFVYTSQDGMLTFSTTAPSKLSKRLALNLSRGRLVMDRAIVRFDDSQPMPKFQLRDGSTKVYIPMNGIDYAVVNAQKQGEVPVNFKAEENGRYTLSFNAEEISFGYLHLIDNKNGINIDLLTEPSYTFEAKTTDYESRFKLVFVCGDANGDNYTFAFYSNDNWVINNEGKATLQVIDVNGRILKSESINGCANVNVNEAPGVYMLRLINGDNMKTQRVVIE